MHVLILTYWQKLLHPVKKINPQRPIFRLLQMALTVFGVERFTKVTVQYIPRH